MTKTQQNPAQYFKALLQENGIAKEALEVFAQICAIPHPSGDTKALQEWICEQVRPFCDIVKIDDVGNIYCSKGVPKICLQAHYDMVLVGKKEPIALRYVDQSMGAVDSSLGADNGVSVALMIVLLRYFEHFECVFTNDEEIGLLGARGLDLPICAKILLNLDSEFFGSVVAGCAGGFILENILTLPQDEGKYPYAYRICAQNFLGGHSGIDIHKSRKNPICEFFHQFAPVRYGIYSLRAGEFHNSIPVKFEIELAADRELDGFLDGSLESFEIQKIHPPAKKMYAKLELESYICALQHGVWERDLYGVSNSLNVAMIRQENENFTIALMGRANTNGALQKNLQAQILLAKKYHCVSKTTEIYTPWEISQDILNSDFLAVIKEAFAYRAMCVETLHAGLECGVLEERLGELGIKGLEILSIGPTIFYPHSRREVLDVPSFCEFSDVVERVMAHYAKA
ncbi:peptidase [Helicobacter mustelae]|uniref:hypothetical protein n=1 Tax=Helicobacter mustelae TaxID=217 RepID=UPI000DF96898|nr:hypothetical protein [Helicobacter mustelae]STP12483.1 peptidase [Helicobacter mustelae]